MIAEACGSSDGTQTETPCTRGVDGYGSDGQMLGLALEGYVRSDRVRVEKVRLTP